MVFFNCPLIVLPGKCVYVREEYINFAGTSQTSAFILHYSFRLQTTRHIQTSSTCCCYCCYCCANSIKRSSRTRAFAWMPERMKEAFITNGSVGWLGGGWVSVMGKWCNNMFPIKVFWHISANIQQKYCSRITETKRREYERLAISQSVIRSVAHCVTCW